MSKAAEDQELVKRITVTLDDDTHQILQDWADSEARTVPNLLAWLALKYAREYQQEKQQQQQQEK
jgi:hypothetical protein